MFFLESNCRILYITCLRSCGKNFMKFDYTSWKILLCFFQNDLLVSLNFIAISLILHFEKDFETQSFKMIGVLQSQLIAQNALKYIIFSLRSWTFCPIRKSFLNKGSCIQSFKWLWLPFVEKIRTTKFKFKIVYFEELSQKKI